MPSARVLVVALLLVAVPLLAAGCLKPRSPEQVILGECREAAYGWLRWNRAMDPQRAIDVLKSQGAEVRTYEGPLNGTWVLFRPARTAENGTLHNFRAVLRVFNLTDPTQDDAAGADRSGEGNASPRHTQISFAFDPPRDRGPIDLPLDAQQGLMRTYERYLSDTLGPMIGLPPPPDTRFADAKMVCPNVEGDDLEPDLTPEGDLVV